MNCREATHPARGYQRKLHIAKDKNQETVNGSFISGLSSVSNSKPTTYLKIYSDQIKDQSVINQISYIFLLYIKHVQTWKGKENPLFTYNIVENAFLQQGLQ
ncbi:hypothetical protein AVEN_179422-1 [Araneus ventricosus]|uniref:Uncharacterized protein n=1 Tax=Araneus ventricosus TaxID=182803 RepID=A0A4Y2BEP0_ARAVE|nr:hypothetical protein AVEN_179422-1 [Araneus ventricosus]